MTRSNNEICRLCGSTAAEYGIYGKKKYYHCPECDLIFLDESFFPGREEEFGRYKKHDNTINNSGYVKYLSGFIKDAGIDKINNIKRTLDFGCGPEPVLKTLLAGLGINTDVYDPFFYPDESVLCKEYDLITSTEVFEHLRNPGKTLNLLEPLLGTGGILAVKTLFHTTCRDFNGWWYRSDITHICFYSPKTFAWIAEAFKLKIRTMDNHSICVLEKYPNTDT
ncbi:methyltransferase associated with DUF414 [Desulfocucumis palustris]|uniref:Methyltransferase associated with DUF414 n=1 Tax=Desulfocucumis palustris TaxID=1898651 RepID=A0A2L2XF05_9FIRM|nr:class I SAM-dependent methyltransferase [Desulfocucumis palustris]GBF34939.1 methyltransferase associated with DUF414 [Desulfocucumis palustris]